MTFRRIAVVLSLTAAVSCGGTLAKEDREETRDSLAEALSVGDFDTTVAQLASLSYLPWAYTIDGCYARALYYSMLLTTLSVPSNHIYSVAKWGTRLGGVWQWHVAPMVTKSTEPNTLYVLDPVYDRTRALTSLEWIAKQDFDDVTDPSYPTVHVHQGNSYGAQNDVLHAVGNLAAPRASEFVEPTFDAMPSFYMSDISDACDTMHRYIERETGTTVSLRYMKHVNLSDETVRIVRELDSKRKLDRDTSLSTRCTSYATPVVDAGPGERPLGAGATDFDAHAGPNGRRGPMSSPR